MSTTIEREFEELDAQNRWQQLYLEIRNESHDYPHRVAKFPENRNRNRYRDVSPYDHSRVKLQNAENDYINASLVDIEEAQRSYILTQGPLPNTGCHFWLMVWQQKTKAVVMLNRVVEKESLLDHFYREKAVFKTVDSLVSSAGSDHLREKDGLWAVLVWLSIIAARKQSVEEIVRDHWAKFGRHYYCRFDYEGLEPKATYYIMRDLEALVTDKSFIGQQFAVGSHVYSVAKTDSFEYVDPVDGTVTKKQGLRIIFSDASRLIFRLSSSSGMRATIRLYAESYERDPSGHDQEPQAVLSPLIAIALKISQIHERTGRRGPTVIT